MDVEAFEARIAETVERVGDAMSRHLDIPPCGAQIRENLQPVIHDTALATIAAASSHSKES